jgi:hypothetical protein
MNMRSKSGHQAGALNYDKSLLKSIIAEVLPDGLGE